MSKLIFKDSEKIKEEIMESQQKEIMKLYNDWANEIGDRAEYYSHKTNASAPLSERYYKELQKQLRQTSQEVSNQIYGKIKSNMYKVSDAVVADNVNWLKSLGFSADGVNAAFSYVPEETVRNLVTGKIYESGWSLSSRIWGDNEDTLKDIYKIMAKGVAENRPIYDIAKNLEAYVRPNARLPWNLRMSDGVKIFKKQVDYNAQRLARTLVQHSYQQSFLATTQKNPFVLDYIWHSNGSRACELCLSRDGQHFKKDELPMDHPNGMCVMEPNVDENTLNELADWFNSPDGTYPEIDEFASSFGYEASKINSVKSFIDKYGMSNKSPGAWYSSLTSMQKAEAKVLKEKSGLTWNKWYEQNIYNGDGTNLVTKKKTSSKLSTKDEAILNLLKKQGYNQMPDTFMDWGSKVKIEDIKAIAKMEGINIKDINNAFTFLQDWYNDNIAGKKLFEERKAIKSAAKAVDKQFDAAAWRKSMRQNDLEIMESWCDDWLKAISSAELDGVKAYTGSAYIDMNEYLRKQSSYTSYAEEIKQATAALEKASLPEEVIVRRGSSYNMLKELGIDISEENKDKLVGGIVQELGFMSTSPDSYGGFSRGIEYVVKVPKGSQAMYVDTISWHSGEEELLINRGGKYIINDVEFDSYGDVKRIYMTLINLNH